MTLIGSTCPLLSPPRHDATTALKGLLSENGAHLICDGSNEEMKQSVMSDTEIIETAERTTPAVCSVSRRQGAY